MPTDFVAYLRNWPIVTRILGIGITIIIFRLLMLFFRAFPALFGLHRPLMYRLLKQFSEEIRYFIFILYHAVRFILSPPVLVPCLMVAIGLFLVPYLSNLKEASKPEEKYIPDSISALILFSMGAVVGWRVTGWTSAFRKKGFEVLDDILIGAESHLKLSRDAVGLIKNDITNASTTKFKERKDYSERVRGIMRSIMSLNPPAQPAAAHPAASGEHAAPMVDTGAS